MISKDVIIIGGGAAGFFAAINIAEQRPDLEVAILERGKEGLTKVKISGGGRCNVTMLNLYLQNWFKIIPEATKNF
jgi:predicted flavoprotein YhiN